VFCLNHYADSSGRKVFLEPVGDLLGQALLDLQVTGKQLDHPGELGQSQNARSRQVAHVGEPVEGQQVMLAQ
jgi:hypothetical protein